MSYTVISAFCLSICCLISTHAYASEHSDQYLSSKKAKRLKNPDSNASRHAGNRLKRVQLLNPERQVFVWFDNVDSSGEGRYLSGELNVSACVERGDMGRIFKGPEACNWLSISSLSKYYLDAMFSEGATIKAYQQGFRTRLAYWL